VPLVAESFPAFCPSCGGIFESGPVAGENAVWRTIAEARETCPRCLGKAERFDATVDVVGETIRAFAASNLTQERLTSLHRVFLAWEHGGVGEEQTLDALASTAPPLASLVSELQPAMGRAILHFLRTVLVMLLPVRSERGGEEMALLLPWKSGRDERPVPERDVRRAVEWVVKQGKVQLLP